MALLIIQSCCLADGIVFIGNDDIQMNRYATCLKREINNTKHTVIDAKLFKEALFPFFEPNTIPNNSVDMTVLLEKPRIKKKTSDLNVRYVVTEIQERTYSGSSGLGLGEIGIGAGGDIGQGLMLCSEYGCLGLATNEKTTDMSLVVWDLENPERSITSDVSADGKDVWVGFFLPIPLPAGTQSTVCRKMAEQIVKFIYSSENQDIDSLPK